MIFRANKESSFLVPVVTHPAHSVVGTGGTPTASPRFDRKSRNFSRGGCAPASQKFHFLSPRQ